MEGGCRMSVNMNEKYKPRLPYEHRAWKIAHEPRMYEYKVPLGASGVMQERPGEGNVSAGVLFLLAFLGLLNCLSNVEGSGIEGLEK